MKRSALVAVMVLHGAGLLAQSWCPPGAEWISKPPVGWPVFGYTRVFYAGDTVVGGMQGQRLAEQHGEQAWGSSDIYYHLHPTAMITATSDGVVYTWSLEDEVWDTLFWFSAQPGDHWQRPHDHPIAGDLSDLIVVTDTTTTIIDGVPLRQLTVEQVCEGTWVDWGGTITDRLGYWSPFYFPDGCTTESGIYELCSYTDNEIHFDQGLPCDIFLSLPSAPYSRTFLYPNPGTDHFTIPLCDGAHFIRLFDTTGREVMNQRAVGPIIQVNVGELPTGLYIVRVDNEGSVHWLKQ